jgi:hypothetical protein
MDGILNVGNYFPDRPPTWSDVVTVVSGLLYIGISVQSFQSSSLPAVALGFSSTVILIGPVAQTRVGKRIGRWVTEIGPDGRATVIGLFAIAVIVTFVFVGTPPEFIREAVLGTMMGYLLVMAAHILKERRIEGWLPESS